MFLPVNHSGDTISFRLTKNFSFFFEDDLLYYFTPPGSKFRNIRKSEIKCERERARENA